MRIAIKDLTPDWLEYRETKDMPWLSETLAGSQGRPPPESSLEIKLEANAYSGNVFVRGEMQAPIVLICSRCADEWLEPMRFPLDLVLSPAKRQREREEDEVELTSDDLSYIPYEGDTIDLDPNLREQIILAVPDYPLCRTDCKGLCQRCGANLNEGACACREEEETDPRLAKLKNFKIAD